MALKRREFGGAALAVLAGIGTRSGPATAQRAAQAQQPYPNRPVSIVVAWAAGGGTDFVARLLAERLSKDLGSPFVVDNRPGASGTVGHLSVARARPDGHTLLLAVNSTYAMSRHLYPQRGYDDERDFQPIGKLATIAAYLCVHRDSPVRDVQGFIAAAKAASGRLTYASPGAGSSGHLAPELFFSMAGIQVENIPYRGGAPMLQALLAKEVEMAFLDVVTALPYIRSGELRALGIGSRERQPLTPEVPTIAEAGVPGFECNTDYALLAPARTPEPIVRRLHEAAAVAMRAPEVQERLTAVGYEIQIGTPEEFPAYQAAESAKWGEVIRSRNIRAE
jgi:tripartite-type tricarboxylate transporter receptor subunit TctC